MLGVSDGHVQTSPVPQKRRPCQKHVLENGTCPTRPEQQASTRKFGVMQAVSMEGTDCVRAVTRQPVRKWWMQQAAGLSCLQRKTAERHRERSNKKSGESKARQRGQLALQEELKSPLAADRRQQQSREPRRWSWSGGRAARQAVGSWWRRVRRRWRLMAAERAAAVASQRGRPSTRGCRSYGHPGGPSGGRKTSRSRSNI